VGEVVVEVGSGMNGKRRKLARVLADPAAGTIVVKHRDRLARFGVEHLEAALSAPGRRVVVVDDGEVDDDLVRDIPKCSPASALGCMGVVARATGRSRRSDARSVMSGRRPCRRLVGACRAMLVHQAFRFELDPNDRARSALARHAGAARYAFNWGLAVVQERLDARRVLTALAVRQGATAEEAGRGRPVWPGTSPGRCRRCGESGTKRSTRWPPWWAENSKEAYNTGLDSLARAVTGFFDSCSGARRGGRVGWPSRKRRHRAARSDGIRKLTTRLARTHAVVVVEDLKVAGMTATAKGSGRRRAKAGLNRAILDTAPGELHRQLAYKTTWYGSALVAAGRWYPSSKTCSRCKTVKPKLSLAEGTYRCGTCGLVIDRDCNAALNLASPVQATIQEPPVEAGTRRTSSRRTRRQRRGTWPRPGAPRRTAKTAPDTLRVRLPPPPSNRRLRETDVDGSRNGFQIAHPRRRAEGYEEHRALRATSNPADSQPLAESCFDWLRLTPAAHVRAIRTRLGVVGTGQEKVLRVRLV